MCIEEIKRDKIGEEIRSVIGVKGRRISLIPKQVNLNFVNVIYDFLIKNNFSCCISNDKLAVVVYREIETKRTKIVTNLIISISSWPNCLSFYCRTNISVTEEEETLLMLGASSVYEGNQTIEIADSTLGAATFIFESEELIQLERVLEEINMLYGFLEYHLDFFEESYS